MPDAPRFTPPEGFISQAEAARRYRVDASTVRDWVNRGLLDHQVVTAPGKRDRILIRDGQVSPQESGDTWMSTGEVAAFHGVARTTVVGWAKAGSLPWRRDPLAPGKNGRLLFSRSAVEAYEPSVRSVAHTRRQRSEG